MIRENVVNRCLAFIRNQYLKTASVLALLLVVSGVSAAQEALDPQRQQELGYVLKHDCGSCHGMTLKGGLGPSLLPELLQGKGHTVESLSVIIRSGVPGTAMPPWGPILKEQDIRWLATQLLKSDLN